MADMRSRRRFLPCLVSHLHGLGIGGLGIGGQPRIGYRYDERMGRLPNQRHACHVTTCHSARGLASIYIQSFSSSIASTLSNRNRNDISAML